MKPKMAHGVLIELCQSIKEWSLDRGHRALGGLMAGIINTLAGNGSVITLSLCTEVIGLSPAVANGTNRLGILTQSIAGTASLFPRQKLLSHHFTLPLLSYSPASVGYGWQTVMDDHSKQLYPWFWLLFFLVLILKPERWLKEQTTIEKLCSCLVYLAGLFCNRHLRWIDTTGSCVVPYCLDRGSPYALVACQYRQNRSDGIIYSPMALAIFGFKGLVHVHTASSGGTWTDRRNLAWCKNI